MGYFRLGHWHGAHHDLWNIASTPGGIFMGIIFLVVIGVIIYLLVSRSRDRQEFTRYFSNPTAPRNNSGALEILRQRYAKGELNEEEFVRMKQQMEP